MADSSLDFYSASEIVELIRSREVSPVDVVDSLLQRIEGINPQLNAYLTVAGEHARSAAKKAKDMVVRGAELPSLHGLPVAVKDLEYTSGIRSTGGSLAYRNFTPSDDSIIVERLKRAGAIILGKTNTPELGSHSETWNLLGEDCRNPWNQAYTPGGSSGGSAAAVATGMAHLATGTDGAGSVRIPASFCGVYGMKPTTGLVPQDKGFIALPTLSVPGVLSRTVADAALMLDAVVGFDARDRNSLRMDHGRLGAELGRPLEGQRIAWSSNLGIVNVSPDVRALAESAVKEFESSGCIVEEAAPQIEQDYFVLSEAIRNADRYASFGHLLDSHADELTPYYRAILELGKKVTESEYSDCLAYVEGLKSRVARFFDKYDLLVTPATAFPPFPLRRPPDQRIGDRDLPGNASAILLTLVWNLTGQPAASVPCGFTSDGFPVGLQIVGRLREDELVLRASATLEQARPWKDAKHLYAEGGSRSD